MENIQEKINEYFSKVFKNKLQYEDDYIFGTKSEVIANINDYSNIVNGKNTRLIDEEIKEENTLINSILSELAPKQDTDIVCVRTQIMDGSFYMQDSKEVLKLLQELYLEQLADNSNIQEFVRVYFEINKITNLIDYGSDRDAYVSPTLSELYKNLLEELYIEYQSITTKDISDGKYETTVTLADNSTIKIDTSAWNTYEVVADNLTSIINLNNELKNEELEI